MGLSSHPNFTGVLLAVTAPVTAYLINASLSRKKMLIFWSVVAGLQAVLIIWAGSRTGALAALFGVMLVFRHRLNRLVVFGAVVVGMGLVVSLLFGEQVSQINTTRTLSTGASGRFELWQTMIAGFLRSPLIGTNEFDGSENSYLVVLVRTGIIGTSLMVAFLIAYLSQLFRIYRSYSSLQGYKPTFDCVLGISGACFLSAVFEGWLQDVVATPILMLIMGSVILGMLDNVRAYVVDNEYDLQTKPMQAYA
jgi:O-antigen ligase